MPSNDDRKSFTYVEEVMGGRVIYSTSVTLYAQKHVTSLSNQVLPAYLDTCKILYR